MRVPEVSMGPRRPVISAGGWTSMFLVAAAIIFLLHRTPTSIFIGLGLLGLAFALQAGLRAARSRMLLAASPQGLVWDHPVKGEGQMRWKDIGALSIREEGPGGEVAFILTPCNEESGPSLIVLASDLAPSRGAARERFEETLTVILRQLAPEVVIDRGSRAWLVRNHIEGVRQ